MRHADIQPGFNHVPFNWIYSDAASRTAASGFVTGDVHKLALDLDTGTVWRVSAVASGDATWQEVGGSVTIPTLDAVPAPVAAVDLANHKLTSVADATAATDGLNRQTGDARYAPVGAAGAMALTAVKTSAYAPAANELVLADITAGWTMPLPTAPADKAKVGFRIDKAPTSQATSLAVVPGGSDTIGSAGAVQFYAHEQGRIVVFQYSATGTKWTVIEDTLPPSAITAAARVFTGIGYFAPPGFTESVQSTANAVVVDSSDRPIIAGELFVNGVASIAVLRLTTAGRPDDTFGTRGWCTFTVPGAAAVAQQGLALQSDGKIVLSGLVINGGVESAIVARITTAGALDTSFNTTGYNVFLPTGASAAAAFGVAEHGGDVYATGGAIISGIEDQFLTRINGTTGAIAGSWGTGGSGHVVWNPGNGTNAANWSIVFDTAGNAIVGGEAQWTFSTTVAAPSGAQNTAGQKLVNLASVGGALPAGLALGSKVTLAEPGVTTTATGAQAFPRATFTVGSTASFAAAGSINIPGVAGSVTYTGKTGTTFTGCTGGVGTAQAGVTVTKGEAILVQAIAGTVVTSVGNLANSYTTSATAASTSNLLTASRLTSVGALDTTFNGTGYNAQSYTVGGSVGFTAHLQSNGKVIVTGNGWVTQPQPVIARFNTDGTVDATFGTQGVAGIAGVPFIGGSNGSIVDSQDRIVNANVNAGTLQTVASRTLPNGQMDFSYGINGNLPTPQGYSIVPNGVASDSAGNLWYAGPGTPTGGGQQYAAMKTLPSGELASDGLPQAPFATPPPALPAAPAAGQVALPPGAVAARWEWLSYAGDGTKTRFTLTHQLGARAVKMWGFANSNGTPDGEISLCTAVDPTDPTARVLVDHTDDPPASGETFWVLVGA